MPVAIELVTTAVVAPTADAAATSAVAAHKVIAAQLPMHTPCAALHVAIAGMTAAPAVDTPATPPAPAQHKTQALLHPVDRERKSLGKAVRVQYSASIPGMVSHVTYFFLIYFILFSCSRLSIILVTMHFTNWVKLSLGSGVQAACPNELETFLLLPVRQSVCFADHYL